MVLSQICGMIIGIESIYPRADNSFSRFLALTASQEIRVIK